MIGCIQAEKFHLGYTLGSGQVFRWGRDEDGWWKGITFGTAFHLRQTGDQIEYSASSVEIMTYAGRMKIEEFLRWYLRIDEYPRLRMPKGDEYVRKARKLLRGFRFARQDPFECIISYVLSVQAHMNLTKERIQFLARILGLEIRFLNERFWAFPEPHILAQLNGKYYRSQRFGWRSERVAESAEQVAEALGAGNGQPGLHKWQEIVDGLKALSGSGVGLKVGKCIDLFSLERLDAVPVDTWVKKFAEDWYGVKGSDAKVCEWGEKRGGKQAGYINEYLFAYYRELNGPQIHDRVISFCESDLPSPVLPFDRG